MSRIGHFLRYMSLKTVIMRQKSDFWDHILTLHWAKNSFYGIKTRFWDKSPILRQKFDFETKIWCWDKIRCWDKKFDFETKIWFWGKNPMMRRKSDFEKKRLCDNSQILHLRIIFKLWSTEGAKNVHLMQSLG